MHLADKKPFSVVSLFCGCGGLDIGFKENLFDVIYACDNNKSAVECYSINVDENVFLRDVTSNIFHDEINSIKRCDVVLGGFPCQGFSKAGPKNVNDNRNNLYLEMKNAVEILQPAIFIAENVDGISQNFKGKYINNIVSEFSAIGYRVENGVLDAACYGLPQYRRRMLFVGIKESLNGQFIWPEPTHSVGARNGEFKINNQYSDEPGSLTLPIGNFSHNALLLNPPKTIADSIGDIIDINLRMPDHLVTSNWPDNYNIIMAHIKQGQKLCNVRHASTSVYTWDIPEVFGEVTEREKIILETIARNRRHNKYGTIPNGNPIPKEDISVLTQLGDISYELDSLIQKGYLYFKLNGYELKGAMFCSGLFKRPFWDSPSPTILTNFYNPRYFIHPIIDRPFSLRECARLQGFNDSFIFLREFTTSSIIEGYRLVGNAVPPPLSRLIAQSVRNFLTSCDRHELALLMEEIS